MICWGKSPRLCDISDEGQIGCASTRPPDAGRIPPLTRSCTGMTPARHRREGARIGGGDLGRCAHFPLGPREISSIGSLAASQNFGRSMEVTRVSPDAGPFPASALPPQSGGINEMHPLWNWVGSESSGARWRRLHYQGPPGVSASSWETEVSKLGMSASRRAGRVGRSGGADRTQCRGRPVRADRTQSRGTSSVHNGGCGGAERTQCRGGRHGHDGGYGGDRSQHPGGRVGGVARRAAACSAWATVAHPRRGHRAGLPGGPKRSRRPNPMPRRKSLP